MGIVSTLFPTLFYVVLKYAALFILGYFVVRKAIRDEAKSSAKAQKDLK